MTFPIPVAIKIAALIEEELDVNRFASHGVHLWPAARFLLMAKLKNNVVMAGDRSPAFQAIDRAIDARWGRMGAVPQADLPHEEFLTPYAYGAPKREGRGILLFSRAEDHNVQTPKGYYATVLDPWRAIAAPHWPVMKAEFSSAAFDQSQPRYVSTSACVRSAAVVDADFLQTARTLALNIMSWLETSAGLSYPTFAEEFQQHMAQLWADKQALSALLDAYAPALVMTNCCYFRPTLPMVWAAREKGIRVADVQHGGNGPGHMGYTHWRHVPEGGYVLLPDFYFTWDTISANNIARWMPRGRGVHQAVITGRFDLDVTRDAILGPGNASPLAIAAFGSAQVVLITLQPHPTTALTPLLLDAMRQAPRDWTWLIRSHPMAVGWGGKDMLPEVIEATLKANGISRFECRLATGLPLGAVLPVATHHITGFSGTVQECVAYGLRTTFTHPAARPIFGHYIEGGMADFASTAGEILASVRKGRIDPAAPGITKMPRDAHTPLAVLEAIMGKGGETRA